MGHGGSVVDQIHRVLLVLGQVGLALLFQPQVEKWIIDDQRSTEGVSLHWKHHNAFHRPTPEYNVVRTGYQPFEYKFVA